MTGILQAILSFFGVAPAAAANYIEDVFSTYLYTGNGSTQTITNNIDLSGKGGLVWIKSRNDTYDHFLYDTARGATKSLQSDTTSAEQTYSDSLTAFNSNGFALGANVRMNANTTTYASWTFRKQAKFFDVVTYTGNGSNRTIAHSLGSAPGCIIIKRTDTAADWQVYHRSLANTEYLVLNSTAAKATGTTRWNSTTPTSTEFSLGTDTTVNANNGTYVAYLFAHDAGGFGATGSDNVISCGSFSGAQTISLGYEPQWVLVKGSDTATNWQIEDNMRGLTADGTGSKQLYPNLSNAEANASDIKLNATGFSTTSSWAGITGIYIAIRRGPMKTPTSGTSVFSPIAATATGGTSRTTGFPVDLQIMTQRDKANYINTWAADRLRGVSTTDSASGRYVFTNTTDAEATADQITRNFGSTGYVDPNFFGSLSMIWWNFRRAPGFFDVVCYTGTGSAKTESHNLGVTPELMIVKNRSDATGRAWAVYAGDATDYLVFNTTAATVDDIAYWNDTAPTSSVFTVGTSNSTNESGDTFVAYLFASVTGVSKVGSYTGTGTTLQVDCGFTAGARFVMIKRTDSTGDWYVWDSARGIVAGDDPYLLLNSTAAEVTNTDYVDTSNAGFEISSTAPAAINANGGTFIFLAIS